MIFQEVLIYYFFSKNNFYTPVIIKKYISYQFEYFLNKEFVNNIIYISILNKYLCINKSSQRLTKYNYVVYQNDALATILTKNCNGISFAEIGVLIRQYPILKNLQKGQILSWSVIGGKNLKSLVWKISTQEIRIYNRVHANFSESVIKIIDNPLNKQFSNKILFIGKLHGTFLDSTRCLGIEESYITDIIKTLQYRLDFKKLRKGDKFSILTSMIIDNDYNVKTGFIGARLNTAGKDYYVFRANNGKYYDNNAVRFKDDFIRFPISKPFRISSNFNLHRLNPVTRQVSPHAGVDFAVPVGTPVLSVGNGEVVVSAYSKISGNYIVIKHNYRCITRYMHLKKLLVKSGQKVQCGQNIALSGNTGRSTGPHLHFEIWIDCHPVNPLTVSLLNTEKLSGNDRLVYLNQISKIIPQLCFD